MTKTKIVFIFVRKLKKMKITLNAHKQLLCLSENKTCRNWVKYTFELPFNVDERLIDFLKSYGDVQILDFSKFSKSSKIFFKMNFKHHLFVEGCYGTNFVFISHSKNEKQSFENFFNHLEQWVQADQYQEV